MKKWIKKIFIFGSLFFLCILLLFFIINQIVLSETNLLIKKYIKNLEPAQVVIVPGAGVLKNKRITHYAFDRITKAVAVYKAGKAKKILISGDSKSKYYDETGTIKHWAKKYGVKEQHILIDKYGLSTYDTMKRAKLLYHINSAIIVTQEFHLPRSLYIAGKKGIKVQGLIADRRTYKKNYAFREYLARVKDFIRH